MYDKLEWELCSVLTNEPLLRKPSNGPRIRTQDRGCGDGDTKLYKHPGYVQDLESTCKQQKHEIKKLKFRYATFSQKIPENEALIQELKNELKYFKSDEKLKKTLATFHLKQEVSTSRPKKNQQEQGNLLPDAAADVQVNQVPSNREGVERPW